jgi:tRNA(Ile)-lysidine synthase
MPTTADPVRTVRAAVKLWIDRLESTPIGVACSGGADSISLADAAIDLAAGRVTVVTIDHQLVAGSDARAAEVAGWARSRGAEALVIAVSVPRRASLEASARDARYAALDRVITDRGLAMLTAHTRRDQAETVLLRILRGTGPAGLAGIPAQRGAYVRPLLDLPRAVIDAYIAARGLAVWDDPMNDDPRFARVRMRREILPRLRAENPSLDDALVRLAASAREWTAQLDAAAAPHARLPIDTAALASLPAAVRKHAVVRALEHHGLHVEAQHLDQVDALICRPARGQLSLDIPGGRLVRSYDRLLLAAPDGGSPPPLVAPHGPYEVRTRRPGDRMKPRRLKGRSRKLSDLYIDAKIPRDLRATARVVVRTTDDVIVWAEHLGTAFGESLQEVPEPVQSGGSF